MVVIIVEWDGEKKWGSRNKNGEAGKQKSIIPKILKKKSIRVLELWIFTSPLPRFSTNWIITGL